MSRKAMALIRAIDISVSYVCIVALVILTVLGVVMRYAVGAPLIWLEEVQMMLIVWLVMFAGSAAFREFGHVSIDAVFEMLPPAGKRALEFVIAIFVLGVLAMLVWAGSAFVQFQFGANRVTDVLRIPYGLVYMAVPVGSLLMMLSYVFSELVPLISANRRVA